jgi:hypothetical protein
VEFTIRVGLLLELKLIKELIIRKPYLKSTFNLKGLANKKALLDNLNQETSMHLPINFVSNMHNVTLKGLQYI